MFRNIINKNMKNYIKYLVVIGFVVLINQQSYAHCEIPCGIYDDELRIALLKEHFNTIEKSMVQIEELQKLENVNYNQLVRWVTNKEDNANKVQEIVQQYFLNQRIKPLDSSSDKFTKYQIELTALHHLLVYSMKAKQTTDLMFIKKLNECLEQFEKSYFKGKHRHNQDGSHK